MSHAEGHPSPCPNCGYPATLNYCASCGQATHLHKDTFLGLVLHFIAHYFHFESKFWVTVRTLILRPGTLSLAYRQKQRARYVPPISLYIFTSALFFLLGFLTMPTEQEIAEETRQEATRNRGKEESVYLSLLKAGLIDSAKYQQAEQRRLEKERKLSPEQRIREKQRNATIGMRAIQMLPRVFFFMVPFSAFILSLFFLRRKDLLFTDHAVFSLHFHAFWFLVWTVSAINPIEAIDNYLTLVILAGCLCYFVRAVQRAYGTGTGKAIAISFGFGLSYALALVFTVASLLAYLVLGAR